ncbi:hypothetical protein EYC80_006334 [Monilinia laxa]|uniref:Peptidase S54 rhomboid domain-containing protein n=1 Tax=Monilinia laxa TaxID=61186 RepID=A0A5N6JRN1_MONLA|nr:hypothetical protein EYC80_006334 [Monilinia laxa]
MEFLVASRALGLHMKKISVRPVAQLPFRKTLSGCMVTRNFNSLFFNSIHPNPLVRKSCLLKDCPPSGFRPFFSSTPLARGTKHPDPQSGKLSKRGQQEKVFKSKLQNQHSQRTRDDYQNTDSAPPRRNRNPRSSYPLAVLIAAGCTYITLSYNRSPFIQFPLPDWVPKFTPSYLEKNFILSQQNIDEGRIHTLITNSFMHANYLHLFMNMFGLSYLTPLVTPLTFVTVWAGAGITCSLASLYIWKHGFPFDHTPKSSSIVHQGCGASGSILGLITMTAIKYPSLSWQLMFIPVSFPGWLLVGGGAIYSTLSLKYGWQPYIGHAGHLGGTAFGLLAGILSMRFGLRRI